VIDGEVFPGVHRKDYGWSVGLDYDHTELPRVTTVRPGVAGVLQIQGEFFCVFEFFLDLLYHFGLVCCFS
jgi:hypothetical protein